MNSISGASHTSVFNPAAALAARSSGPAVSASRGRDMDGDNDGSKLGEVEGAMTGKGRHVDRQA